MEKSMKKSLIKLMYNPYLTAVITLVTLGFIAPRLISAKSDELAILGVTTTLIVAVYAVKSINYFFKDRIK